MHTMTRAILILQRWRPEENRTIDVLGESCGSAGDGDEMVDRYVYYELRRPRPDRVV